jgi:hypothetical protein
MATINEEGRPEAVDEERGTTADSHIVQKEEPEDEYPPLKKLLFIMGAIYLCIFIVALVSGSTKNSPELNLTLSGPDDYWDRNTPNYR